MALVRTTALKDFTVNALSTTDVSTGYQLGALTTGQSFFAALHLTQQYCTTDRTFVGTVESATASAFGAAATRATFTKSTLVAGEWATPVTGLSTEHSWWRAKWTLSTAASNSTGGAWKGLIGMGIR